MTLLWSAEIVLSLFVGLIISLFLTVGISKLFGLNNMLTASMLTQAATTAIAMPVAGALVVTSLLPLWHVF